MTPIGIYKADVYCIDCTMELRTKCYNALIADNGDSDTYPQVVTNGEADSPQHCDICGGICAIGSIA